VIERDDVPTVALFIDYEYVVYGALNKGCRVPTPEQLAALGTRAGRLVDAKAFADFGEEQLAQYGNGLMTASIEQINCPADRRPDGQAKSYTDFYMLDHLYRTTHTNPTLDTYVLVTGDGHFRAVAAFIRYRLQRRVIVAGYPDSTNRLLQQTASQVELIELVPFQDLDDAQITNLIRSIDAAEQADRIVTLTSTAKYFATQATGEDAVRAALLRLAEEGVFEFREETAPDHRMVRRMYLNRSCPRVATCLAEPRPLGQPET